MIPEATLPSWFPQFCMRGEKEAIGYDCEGLQSGEYGCAVHTCGDYVMSVMSEEEVTRRLSYEGLMVAPCVDARSR